jgi:cytochrome c
VQTEPEATPGALAPRPAQPLSEAAHAERLTLTGGAGLFDHSARDPLGPSAGMWAGLSAIVATGVLAVWLISMNPGFTNGKAAGTANQLGAPAAAAAGPDIAPGSPAAEGVTLIGAKGCGGCHTIPGVAGATQTIGPNLGGVASRTKIAGGAVNNTGPDDLKKWITDPPGTKPGTAMPKIPMTDEEATKMVAYLETLK